MTGVRESNVVSVMRKKRESVRVHERERGREKKNDYTLRNFVCFGICIIMSEHF